MGANPWLVAGQVFDDFHDRAFEDVSRHSHCLEVGELSRDESARNAKLPSCFKTHLKKKGIDSRDREALRVDDQLKILNRLIRGEMFAKEGVEVLVGKRQL